jgi:ribosome-associated protein
MDSTPQDRPSKSQKKRAMLSLQATGAALVELNDTQLMSLDLPDELAAALTEMRRTKSHEGKRRQLQYIGRIMRQVDGEAIAAKLEQMKQPARDEVARLHRAEQWRDRLLSDADALAEFAALRPDADPAPLGKLVQKAREERAKSRPPRAYRELFRALSEWLKDKET